MLKGLLYISPFLLVPHSLLFGQLYYEADPTHLLRYERDYFRGTISSGSLLFRPQFEPHLASSAGRWSVTVRGDYFENDGAPNLENTSVRWVGKGISRSRSLRLSYSGENVAFSLEPYRFENENLDYAVPIRKGIYKRMNDAQPHGDSALIFTGVKEFQLFYHHSGVGVGVSNANMWWGPGLHSSLHMSTNAPGFRYFSAGTIGEQRFNNVGIDIRYLFTHLDKRNAGTPYFTALLLSSTFYTNPQFTFGLTRSYLSGHGTARPSAWSYISPKDAMLLPFEELFLEQKQKDPDNPESAVDLWDEIMVAYVVASFPSSGLKVYVEYGRDDHAWDWDDFTRQPDHSGAGVIGLRKFGLFRNQDLVGGLEYTSLIKSRFWTKRVPGTWYSKGVYDYNSYDGRWWGAHSGPDSDDFYIYLGYMSDRFSFIPAFNYERHGVIDNTAVVLERRPYLIYDPNTGRWIPTVREEWRERQVNIWPEVKMEFRLDVRFALRGFDFNFYYENEFVDNLEFKWGERRGKVWWIGVEKTIDSESFKSFRNRK